MSYTETRRYPEIATVEDYLSGVGVPWAFYEDRPIPLPEPVSLLPACGDGPPTVCETLGDLLLAVALDPDFPTCKEAI